MKVEKLFLSMKGGKYNKEYNIISLNYWKKQKAEIKNRMTQRAYNKDEIPYSNRSFYLKSYHLMIKSLFFC